MFRIIENYKSLFLMGIRNDFAGELQNKAGPSDNIKLDALLKDSEIKAKLTKIHGLLDKSISDDLFGEAFLFSGGSINTKKEILKEWLGDDVASFDDGLVDNQVKALLKKMNGLDASEEQIKKETKLLLDDIHDKLEKGGLKDDMDEGDAYKKMMAVKSKGFAKGYEKRFKDKALESLQPQKNILEESMQDTDFSLYNNKKALEQGPGLLLPQIIAFNNNVKKLGGKGDLIINTIGFREKIRNKIIEIENKVAATKKKVKEMEKYLANPQLDKYHSTYSLNKHEKAIITEIDDLNTEINELGIESLAPLNYEEYLEAVSERRKVLVGQEKAERAEVDRAVKALKLPENVYINTDIFSRTLKKGMEGSDVLALQEFLGIKQDGKFGRQTEYALKAYQKKHLKYRTPDGILTVGSRRTYGTLKSIKDTLAYRGSSTNIYMRKTNYKDVKGAVEYSTKRIEALTKLVENSDEFYQALEGWIDGGFRDDLLSDMGGALGLFRGAVGFNNADEYFDKLKSYDEMREENEDKFNDAIADLIPKGKHTKLTQRQKSSGSYLARDLFIGFVFHDLPLLDIRMNCMKRLATYGIPMDKALAFKNWVDGGMKGKPDYSKKNLEEISGVDAVESLWSVRANLTAYGFSNKKINSALRGDLEQLSEKESKLFRVILEKRIIPDLKTLNRGGFNVLEKIFDDKYGDIKNIFNKLHGKDYLIDSEKLHHDIILKKYNKDVYILEVDDWGANTYKTFYGRPKIKTIHNSIDDYVKLKKKGDTQGWENYTREVVEHESHLGDEEGEKEWIKVIKVKQGYLLENDGKYKLVSSKPTEEELIAYTTKEGKKSWKKIGEKGKYNTDISTKEVLQDVGSVIGLLEEQYDEGRALWFGKRKNKELKVGIDRVRSRYDYVKELSKQQIFLDNAIALLSKSDKKLFERYSMLGVFENVGAYLQEFPASKEVVLELNKLAEPTNTKEYAKVLENVLRNRDVIEYLRIVKKSSKDNRGMRTWEKYRSNNIPKYTGLKRVNQSWKRRNKYGEVLDRSISAEDAIKKLKSETTEKGEGVPSKNIFGNLEDGLLDIGITDITSTDLENAISKTWEAKPIETLKGHLINTANRRGFAHDTVTSFAELESVRKDTHVFHTVVEKDIIIYKKTGEKVVLHKKYDIYLRPECNNILVVPGSKNIGEKLVQADFNMDISSLKTPTVPITLSMVTGLFKAVKGMVNGGGNTPGTSTPSTHGTTTGGSGSSSGSTGGGTTI